MLKAIETRYKGYRFRSRLEARWAVFFDTLGVAWEYEKEGYDLGPAGWYLPDFYLTRTGRSYANEAQSVWAEVKAEPLTGEELAKCHALARLTERPCILLVGVPDFKAYDVVELGDDGQIYTDEVLLHSSKNRFWWQPSETDLDVYVREDANYRYAVESARSARFEHGERP